MALENTVQRLSGVGVVAILRRLPADKLLRIAEALLAGGMEAIEITVDSPGALDAIAMLCERYGDRLLVGAGTLMTTSQVEDAVTAGAEFLLSPHFDAELVRAAHKRDRVMVPGVLTPTEIAQALRAGAQILKVFPIGPLGPSYIKDLLGPFRGTKFLPTGGIRPEAVADYVRAGAVGVGLGSALLPPGAVERGDWAAIAAAAARLLAAVRSAKA
ncbi:MAG: bifunctional 4-hydroxy-2-oxoglutarate aldolase/2-dehydro-3-deoxy-phosphogluconate aldolase [Alicyclobacillaceae bacterium]|nr:bifunctional 4-hydroxy-2-oxoglutarate aldolase/2-dehydro-3-deoxy-phosphogluconate aldolase [Alicyclobacillaceae bacterium]